MNNNLEKPIISEAFMNPIVEQRAILGCTSIRMAIIISQPPFQSLIVLR